jgi:hypothetical protein
MNYDGMELVTEGDFLSISRGIQLLANDSGDLESNTIFYAKLMSRVMINFGKALKNNSSKKEAIEIAFKHKDFINKFKDNSVEQATIKSQEWIIHTTWLESLERSQRADLIRFLLEFDGGHNNQHLILMTVGRG